MIIKRNMLRRFAEKALISYEIGDPQADHHLKLIQFNTIRGLTKNAFALGFSFDWLICEAVSPFGREERVSNAELLRLKSTPATLRPTELQLSRRHHPWLDLLPSPRMRYNLFVAGIVLGPEDEEMIHDQLFRDIIESGGGQGEWTGIAVWGEPWDPKSWEMSEPFVRRWEWLIEGCSDMMIATNHWRGLRGDKPLASPHLVWEEGGKS